MTRHFKNALVKLPMLGQSSVHNPVKKVYNLSAITLKIDNSYFL